MLTIKHEVGPETIFLHLSGELTIETATALKDALLEAFAAPPPRVQLDGSGLVAIDFFGLQLLCSAHRTAMSSNKLLLWHNGRPPQLLDSMRITGFTRHCGCTKCPPGIDCMWL